MDEYVKPDTVSGKATVDVSIVMGSNHELVFACLDTLLEYLPAEYVFRFVVTCNPPSGDAPERLLARYAACNLLVIVNPEPQGFAVNHNRVLAESQAEYVFILNDDLLFPSGSVAHMLAFLERPEHQRVAMLSPKLLNPDGSLQRSTYRFPVWWQLFATFSGLRFCIPFTPSMDKMARWLKLGAGRSRFWMHDQTLDVDTFRGACVLGRMAAVRQVGLMQTVSRAGGEESEWHYRLRQHRWRVVFFHEASVIHYGGQTRSRNPMMRIEELKSAISFFRQHRPFMVRYAFALATTLGLLLRCGWYIWHRQPHYFKAYLDGLLLVMAYLVQGCPTGSARTSRDNLFELSKSNERNSVMHIPLTTTKSDMIKQSLKRVLALAHTTLPTQVYQQLYEPAFAMYRAGVRLLATRHWCWHLLTGNSHARQRAATLLRLMPHSLVGWRGLEASYNAVQDALARNVPGALVECGVARGGSAAVLALAALHANELRPLWLFDSFVGLPDPTADDFAPADTRTGSHVRPLSRGSCLGTCEQVETLLFDTLHLDPQMVMLVKGWFQDTLPAVARRIGPIAVLRIDGDWYASTCCCLEYLYEAVAPGGVVIIDDYGTCFGAQKALDEFLAERQLRIALQFDGRGGCLFVKPPL